jgi:hypothetical protein
MIDPLSFSYQHSNRPTNVLLPQPLAPTRAVVLPAGIERLRFFNTLTPGREGYEKHKSLISMCPLHVAGFIPSSDSGSSLEGVSIISKSSEAAAAVFENVWNDGAIADIVEAAMSTEKTILVELEIS